MVRPDSEPVVRALGADDDAALEGHARERLLHHGVAGLTGADLVAPAEPAAHRERGRLGSAEELETAVATADRPRLGQGSACCRAHVSSVPAYMTPMIRAVSPLGVSCVTARVVGFTPTSHDALPSALVTVP